MKNIQNLDRRLFQALIKKEAENNLAFFAIHYFPHYLRKDNSPLHFYLYETLKSILETKEGRRVSIAAPRGNAKSSLVSLIYPIWCTVFKKKKFIILISDTASQANSFLENIRSEFENNELLKKDFGNLVGEIWRHDSIVTSNGIKITALGARKKIRGLRHKEHRPDLIVCDDLENDENTVNPEQRKKNENWFFKAVSKAGDETTDIVVVGTIIHYDSLLTKLLKNPLYQSKKFQAVQSFSQSSRWDQWENLYLDMTEEDKKETPNKATLFFKENEKEMLEGAEVLWPQGQPYYRLMEIRLTEGPASFNSEYQNNPIDSGDCLFQDEWFTYIEPDWENYVEFVGACDPSMGKTATSDYSAIIIIGKHKEGFLDVLFADIERRHPDKIIHDIIQIASEVIKNHPQAPFRAFGVESVQFQEYFKNNLDKESREKGLYLPVVSTENQTTKKSLRIQTLQPLVKNGIIRFQKKHRLLLEQLKYYTPDNKLYPHDDGPDALEMAVRKARVPQLVSIKY